jgi:hypothetical protein
MIGLAYIFLHAGISSYMDDTIYLQHPASEEEYSVSHSAAEMVRYLWHEFADPSLIL